MPVGGSVRKVGVATSDWSGSVADERGYPALGGAGWARLGQLGFPSKNHWIYGTLIPMRDRIGVGTWDQRLHVDCDVFVLQRLMRKSLAEQALRARASGQVVINDLDDWFWGLHPRNAAYALVDPDNNADENILHYKQTLLASNAIVVSTPFLADRVTSWTDVQVEIIRNGVDVRRFPMRLHRKAEPIIGWVGSTAHRSGDLEILRGPLADLASLRVHHTGQHPQHPRFADEVGISEGRLSTLPMLAPHEYPHGFQFDVGVVPLVDIPFNHAKSNIKGLEYAAAGIPFVASPLPEYVLLAEEHRIGRLAKTASDWKKQLIALCDYDTRVAEARRQREAVQALSVKPQARQWDELIWSLV